MKHQLIFLRFATIDLPNLDSLMGERGVPSLDDLVEAVEEEQEEEGEGEEEEEEEEEGGEGLMFGTAYWIALL